MSELDETSRARDRVALVVPVGGKWEAPLRAIEASRPRYVAFLVSDQTLEHIEKIEQRLVAPLSHARRILTPNAEDLNLTFREVRSKLPAILDEWRIGWDDVVVDLTGGTKVMAAALVLATIHHAPRYLYIGGERSDQGTGTVLSGHEHPIETVNPWDQLAVSRLRRIGWAFNKLQFAEARAQAVEARQLVDDRVFRAVLVALERLADGFAAWDRFEHRIAENALEGTYVQLALAWEGQSQYAPVIGELRECQESLKAIRESQRTEAPSTLLLHDLLANAVRRGDTEQHYDDAVARLYRFVEGLAQQALWDDFSVKTGDVRPDFLPAGEPWDSLRQEAAQRGQKIEVSLSRAYALLAAKLHPLGAVAPRLERDGDFGRALQARNQSLLAHGTSPVGKEGYEKLLQLCLGLAGLHREDLRQFPRLPEA